MTSEVSCCLTVSAPSDPALEQQIVGAVCQLPGAELGYCCTTDQTRARRTEATCGTAYLSHRRRLAYPAGLVADAGCLSGARCAVPLSQYDALQATLAQLLPPSDVPALPDWVVTVSTPTDAVRYQHQRAHRLAQC